MADIDADVKNESRTIQYKIANLETLVKDIKNTSRPDSDKVVDMAERLRRVETMLTDKVTHMQGMIDDIHRDIVDIRDTIRLLRTTVNNNNDEEIGSKTNTNNGRF